jgi:uncharacterized membrane protein
MSPTELMGVVTFAVMLLAAISGVWFRVEGKINEARARADKVGEDLASHRLHTAETYVSKQGLRETTDQIMEAIHGVKAAVDHMTMRVDRIVENQIKRPTPRA